MLVAAGVESTGAYLDSAELYDPATGTWSNTGRLSTARHRHTASLLPNGRVLVVGGFNVNAGGGLVSAELYDVGLGFQESWRPILSAVTLPPPTSTQVAAVGSGFAGFSEASGGISTQNSSTNYPLLQVRSLSNDQAAFMLPNPAAGWSDTSFTGGPVSGFPPGYALTTIFTNGIPSLSKTILIPGP